MDRCCETHGRSPRPHLPTLPGPPGLGFLSSASLGVSPRTVWRASSPIKLCSELPGPHLLRVKERNGNGREAWRPQV